MRLITPIKNAKASVELTSFEMRLIRAFRAVCDDSQELCVLALEGCASNPMLARAQNQPALRVLSGGGTA